MSDKQPTVEYKKHPKHGWIMRYTGDLNWQLCEGKDLEAMKKEQTDGNI